jgi:hypothetical protein
VIGLSSLTNRCVPPLAGAAVLALAVPGVARGDAIGLAQLRALDPTLNGSGVRVAQPEAGDNTDPPTFEVNPNAPGVNQPNVPFVYSSTNGTSTVFPNAIGAESSHAEMVAAWFYGTTYGVAPNVARVDNYDADHFINDFIAAGGSVPAAVINQSFVVDDASAAQVQRWYDNYAAQHPDKIFVNGAGNVGSPASPSTMYNGIAVGAYGGSSAVGPTADGRSKPDIVAPEASTSFSTPQVSGAAAILLQAGARGDAGAANATATQDFRVVKALLLNGATKPDGWVHTQTTPLDPRYGAGVLNIYNSYQQLHAGRQSYVTVTAPVLGGPHLPPAGGANEASNVGWAFDTLTSNPSADVVGHYFFNVTSPSALTATLDWDLPGTPSADLPATLNNLDLFLYDAATGALVDQSVSSVDNVEHLYDATLPAGRYDLEVLLHGSVITPISQTYGLAYNFAPVPEPAAGMILLASGSVLLVRRRRAVE